MGPHNWSLPKKPGGFTTVVISPEGKHAPTLSRNVIRLPLFWMTRVLEWLRQVILPNRVWDGPEHWARSYFQEAQQNLAADVASILVEQLGVSLKIPLSKCPIY